MAAIKRTGLGRGLDALLDPYTEEEMKSGNRTVLELSVNDIDTNKEQPRKSFDEDALKELADSIKTHGIIQPIIVRKKEDRYLIVAGERRYRAARIAGLKKVPVVTVEYDDAQMAEVALIENIQRENLNPIEEASAIRFLMKQHDMTQEEVSERIGKSRPAVANSLRLLNLPEKTSELVKTGVLSAGHGRAIAGIPDQSVQLKVTDECVRMGYSVRALETRIKNLETGKKKSTAAAQVPQEIKEFEKKLREKTGAKVSISGDLNKGKIQIEYFSKDELNGLYDFFLPEEN